MHVARVRVAPSRRAADARARGHVRCPASPERRARRRATQSPWRFVRAAHGRFVSLANARAARARDVARASQAGCAGNWALLGRSLRKWRDRFGARVSERDIAELEAGSRRALERAS